MKHKLLTSLSFFLTLLFTACSSDNNEQSEDIVSPLAIATSPQVVQTSLLVEGRQWCIGWTYGWPDTIPAASTYEVISLSDRYECNGKTYRKLNRSVGSVSLSPVREEEGKVYVLDTVSKKETLDFDCNIKVGDMDVTGRWELKGIFEVVVGQKQAVKRKCFRFGYTESELRMMPEIFQGYHRDYIEGIGYIDGAFLHDPMTTGGVPRLVCCHDADGTCIFGDENHQCPITR